MNNQTIKYFAFVLFLTSNVSFGQKKIHYKQISENFFQEFIGNYSISEERSKTEDCYTFIFNSKNQLLEIVSKEVDYVFFYNENYVDRIEIPLDERNKDYNYLKNYIETDIDGDIGLRFYYLKDKVSKIQVLNHILFPENVKYLKQGSYSSSNFEQINAFRFRKKELNISQLPFEENYEEIEFDKKNLFYDVFNYDSEGRFLEQKQENVTCIGTRFYHDHLNITKVNYIDKSFKEFIAKGYTYEFDKNGFLSTEKNSLNSNGVFQTKFVNDNNGNVLKISYFNTSNQAINHPQKGYFTLENTYEKTGKLIKEKYVLSNGKVGFLNPKNQQIFPFSGIIYAYDENNLLLKETFIDSNDKPIEFDGFASKLFKDEMLVGYENAKGEFISDQNGIHHMETVHFKETFILHYKPDEISEDSPLYACYSKNNELLIYVAPFGENLNYAFTLDENNSATKELWFKNDGPRFEKEELINEQDAFAIVFTEYFNEKLVDYPQLKENNLTIAKQSVFNQFSRKNYSTALHFEKSNDSLFMGRTTRFMSKVNDIPDLENFILLKNQPNAIIQQEKSGLAFWKKTNYVNDSTEIYSYFDSQLRPIKMKEGYFSEKIIYKQSKVEHHFLDINEQPTTTLLNYSIRIEKMDDAGVLQEISFFDTENQATETFKNNPKKSFHAIKYTSLGNNQWSEETINSKGKLCDAYYFSSNLAIAKRTYTIVFDNETYENKEVNIRFFNKKGKRIVFLSK